MAAGGYGHIPLPLIRGEIAYEDPPDEYSQEVGFLGNMANGPRKQMLEILKQSLTDSKLSHLFAHSKFIRITCTISVIFSSLFYHSKSFLLVFLIQLLIDWIELLNFSILHFFSFKVYLIFRKLNVFDLVYKNIKVINITHISNKKKYFAKFITFLYRHIILPTVF